VFDFLKSLKELLFPLLIGCGDLNYWLCPTCQGSWSVGTKKSFIENKPVYFKADYNHKTSAVILAAKKIITILQSICLPEVFHNQFFMQSKN
jgi:hypothetical protein